MTPDVRFHWLLLANGWAKTILLSKENLREDHKEKQSIGHHIIHLGKNTFTWHHFKMLLGIYGLNGLY